MKVYAWETPPPEDQQFVLFVKPKKMVLFKDMEEYRRNKYHHINDESDIYGWLSTVKTKQLSNFLGMPPPPPKLKSKAPEQIELQ